jgi:copper homeostasis protein
MNSFILECCVDSVESAIAAAKGGANRLELCSSLITGGVTPSKSLYEIVKRYCNLKLHVLIRPRFGDFLYSDYEFEVMKKEVEMFRGLGADGVVIGCLNADGTLNLKQMEDLIQEAGDMSVTLHRAFDVCSNPREAWKQASDIGISTILTSGQKNTCIEGKDLIGELVRNAAGKVDILVGGGVNAEVIKQLWAHTKAQCYHMSGKTIRESNMHYRKEDVSMGIAALNEYQIWQTEEKQIELVRKLLEQLE